MLKVFFGESPGVAPSWIAGSTAVVLAVEVGATGGASGAAASDTVEGADRVDIGDGELV